MKYSGQKLIAIGIVLSNEERMEKVKAINDEINALVDGIRSSGDIDGMPHGTSVGDSVGSRLEKKEKLETQRDFLQSFVSAVEWAYQYVSDYVSDEDAPHLRNAIYLYIHKKKNQAQQVIRTNTYISPSAFYRLRSMFLTQILEYLNL